MNLRIASTLRWESTHRSLNDVVTGRVIDANESEVTPLHVLTVLSADPDQIRASYTSWCDDNDVLALHDYLGRDGVTLVVPLFELTDAVCRDAIGRYMDDDIEAAS